MMSSFKLETKGNAKKLREKNVIILQPARSNMMNFSSFSLLRVLTNGTVPPSILQESVWQALECTRFSKMAQFG